MLMLFLVVFLSVLFVVGYISWYRLLKQRFWLKECLWHAQPMVKNHVAFLFSSPPGMGERDRGGLWAQANSTQFYGFMRCL